MDISSQHVRANVARPCECHVCLRVMANQPDGGEVCERYADVTDRRGYEFDYVTGEMY